MVDVVTIGTATRDVFIISPLFKAVEGAGLRRAGFAPGAAECFTIGAKIEVEAPVFAIGGGAANSAITFARQGLKAVCVAKLGNDDTAGAVIKDISREGVKCFCGKDRAKGTSYSVILLSESGERTIFTYRGASEDLQIRDIPFEKIKSRWAYIVPGRIPYPVIAEFIKRAKKNKTRIAINFSQMYLEMGAKKLKPILDALDVVIVNREEAALLTGVEARKADALFRQFDEIVPGIAVVTDGARGVLVSDGTTLYRTGVFKEKKLVDRTGAGDAFGSGFVASLAASGREYFGKNEIESAIRLGSANATSVVEHIGAQGGILTARQFAKDMRWKHLPIYARKLI